MRPELARLEARLRGGGGGLCLLGEQGAGALLGEQGAGVLLGLEEGVCK